jgi:hypothetical protein
MITPLIVLKRNQVKTHDHERQIEYGPPSVPTGVAMAIAFEERKKPHS